MSNYSLEEHVRSALRLTSNPGLEAAGASRLQRKAKDLGLSLDPSSIGRPGLTPNKMPRSAPFLTCNYEDSDPSRPHLVRCNSASSSNTSLLSSSINNSSLHNGSLNASGLQPRRKSPGRSLKVKTKTPTRATGASGSQDNVFYGDRLMPLRPTDLQLERAQQAIIKKHNEEEGIETKEELTQLEQERRTIMEENLNDGKPVDSRILHYSRPPAPKGDTAANANRVLYSSSKASVKKAANTRHIPGVPERVLDAPELRDDYYLHLLDWSANNHMAVALAGTVYLWNATDGGIVSLTTIDPPDYVCSLSWIRDGSVLAVGTSEGAVQLWDAANEKLIRQMTGHEARVACLAWNGSQLSSGSRSGQVLHHDVRVAQHVTAVLPAHNQEVCGMAWSASGRRLATGGNDNTVALWDGRATAPCHRLAEHSAAVKAVAWCPWQEHLLATGGGTADRTIRLWNATSGACIKEVPANSQVSSIVWNEEYKELISGHGFSKHQLTVWKYPSFATVTELTGHTGRVLKIVPSPSGEMVASAAADETIRMWQVWPALPKEKKARALQPTSSVALNMLR